MAKSLTRRNVLKVVGGSVAGLAFTPIPWKVIDDISIWSQNWSWMPVPPRGKINSAYTVCTICPAGCAVRARSVAGQPVSMWVGKSNPAESGALCPVGFAGHHLPYHPSRMKEPVRVTRSKDTVVTEPVSREDVINKIRTVISNLKPDRSVALLDQRPERTISCLYRQCAAGLQNGLYLTTGSDGGETYDGLRTLTGDVPGNFGIDLENTASIISFGAPLTEGWGTPGRVAQLMNRRASGQLRLVQVETRYSHTAAIADRWLPVKPGTEAVLALAIAHVLVKNNLVDTNRLKRETRDFSDPDGRSYEKLLETFTPAYASSLTGITAVTIRDTAEELVRNAPAIAIYGSNAAGGPMSKNEQLAVWGLNVLLGTIGTRGGYVARHELPLPTSVNNSTLAPISRLAETPDHSIQMLIIDEAESGAALPWNLIRKKLVQDDPIVISLSPYLVGLAKHADYIVPAPAFLESYQDVPPSFDQPRATYAVSGPLVKPRADSTEPAEFIADLARAAGIDFPAGTKTYAALLRERVHEIYSLERGTVIDGRNGRVTEAIDIRSPQQLWDVLTAGGYWIDEERPHEGRRQYSLLGEENAYERLFTTASGTPESADERTVTVMPFGWRGVVDIGPVSPLLTKLYQETEYRQSTNQALIHPDTARQFGLRDGNGGVIETETGTLPVTVIFNKSVMPGVVHVALGPDQDSLTGVKKVKIKETVLSVSRISDDATWRTTPATIRAV
jgi:menaquinone reductase, molybdopterin-binding-like subunit